MLLSVCGAAAMLAANTVAATERITSESSPRAYTIPAGKLSDALAHFAASAGVPLSFDPTPLGNLKSPGLQGRFTVEEGFRHLLAGSGYELEDTGGGRYSLKPSTRSAASPAGQMGAAANLPTVVVDGRADRSGASERSGTYNARGTDATASGLDLRLRDTPQSVTVVTRQRIEDENLNTMALVLDVTPGISPLRAGATGSPAVGEIYYARGFEVTNYQIDGLSTAQLGLQAMAGTRSGIGGTSTGIYDRIVVVRGATGLMNGAGNPAASINLVRKRPSQEFQGTVDVSAGRWGRYDTQVDVGGPLNEAGTVRGRAVIAGGGGGEWMVRHRSARNSVFYGVLEADLTPSTLLTVGLEQTRNSDRGISFNNFAPIDSEGRPTYFPRNGNASAPWAYANVSRTNAFATLDHQFDNRWKAKLSVQQTRLDHDQVFGYSRGDIDAETRASSFEYGKTIYTPRTNGMAIHLSGPFNLFGREHELMASWSYENLKASDPAYRYRFDVPIDNIDVFARTGYVAVGPSQPNGRARTRIRQSGGYLATRLRPADGLAIIAGTRISNYRYLSNYTDIDESGVVTPYLGVVLDLGKQISAYASYTSIFNPQDYKDRTGKTLSPEKGKNYEIGLKGSFLDGRVDASAAVFWTRKDNLAVLDEGAVTPQGNDAYVGADNARARGYDLEVSGELARNWRLTAGFTQVAVKDGDGKRIMQNIPQRQFKLFTSYTFAGDWRGLTLGGGVTWQSRTSHPYNSNPAFNYGSFALYNLMARYRLNQHLSAQLNVSNLFDKTYRSNFCCHNYGTPRNVTASVKYEF